ncbi:acetyl-CoA carboxylase biotin carboxylase subunit [Polycladomyces subterraneus]|uniref:Acetyl-CoA carboxylase biotin carboxylase subunit n=1 Tax=Polycladomyces subterraneus TaxID=1016997 RepID=A0ABT8IQ73_9BACL|nr:acetyl-CoA carboxylase biotin carboxylase subunit [Polycladomyces subterraneus]MDN4594951.1 acetyl-CoA carboxylase biotin carboxylase subunit [Polycladomyces subterraneus]
MQTILIANRGEIARRIARTCRARGFRVVAVYSEADQDMPFVREADVAIAIGPPPVAQSYLNIDAIIQAAKQSGADAIHPGYGLLSENATFARKVQAAGLVFIGPRPEVIERMGDKVTARRTMEEAGVPVVPGTEGGISGEEEALAEAGRIGYPVMIKASAGGGGIGMQVCRTPDELKKALPIVQSKAKAYFGDSAVFLERLIERPRHVEVQVAADSQGNTVHLFERECSVQRRNQKVVEESLSPSIRPETRERLYEAAVRAAEAVGYTGVGTVEFLVDEQERIYFLEMNTRLQVEHPVTEMVTGQDLVDWQLDIAEGKPLPLRQHEIKARGHAVEYRIYAEDPTTFLPSPGTIHAITVPEGEGIRVDAGVEAGNQVTPFYDPMIAKLIVSGPTRETVLEKSRAALEQFQVEGIRTNLPLLRALLDHPEFVDGQYDTQLLQHFRVDGGVKR